MRAVVHPVERAGDHSVLTVDYTMPEGPAEYTCPASMVSSGRQPLHPLVRLLDLPGGRAWLPGTIRPQSGPVQPTATGNNWKWCFNARNKTPEEVTLVTFYGPVDVDTVDVFIPKLGLVTGVPVVDGGPGTPDLASLGRREGQVEYPEPVVLESLVRAYDEGASARKSGDAQTVVMASDVLFDTDVAELSEQAAARVDEVSAQVAKVASGGQVSVVGHTDDVLSVEYNLDLSKRRAASVAERMRTTLGPSFTVVEDGKGKSEPAVEGTSPEARATNRRVEISFAAHNAVDLPGASKAPEATGPVGTSHETLTYSWGSSGGSTFTVQARSVVRRDGYLVGTLVLTAVTKKAVVVGYFGGDNNLSGQREGDWWHQSPKNVTLLGPQGRVFPTRFWMDDKVRLVADTGFDYSMASGDATVCTILWPDTGENLVTIDVPERFRITDIPVEEG